MAPKISSQKYNGARGKENLIKKIAEKLLKIDPDDVSADIVWTTYGLGQLTCGKHSVPAPKATNCKENPYCLGRLGLEKFEKLIKKSEELRNEKMVESVRRDALKQPCGLVNWANFCYVNSFLQIWFNDPVFRQIIYDWRPSEAYVTPVPPAMDVQHVMNALQHLFFTLDTTPYEDANGEAFCTALRLNQEQQDAQEFTVMFFDSIDRNLMKHPNGRMMRDRIGARFNGSQTSSLRCKCGHHSDNTTKFSALNLSIDGHTTLSAAIQGYFADECLSDFACSGCGQRGGVVRETRIDHLPPVLLLSLNRYVYDSNTGRRKKLKTPLQYPRVLSVDRLPHSEQLAEEDSKYELSAVMVHEGDNADCGHYWDIIRHPYSGVWFKYNDKIVKETKAPGVETEKETALAKPNIDLKFCYGLVYRRREPKGAKEARLPPEEISGKWTKEMNHKFYRMTDTDAEASEITVGEVSQRFRVVGEHMAALEIRPDRAFQKRARDIAFLPTKLLAGILTTEYDRAVKLKEELEYITKELDANVCEEEDKATASQNDPDLNSPQKRKKNVRRRVKSMYDKRLEQVEIATSLSPTSLALCPHERISFDSVLTGEVKAVNRAAAEKLCQDYGLAMNVVTEEGVARPDRLRTGLEVCTECVQEKTRDVHFTSALDDDATLAAKIFKEVNTRCSIKAFFNRQPPRGSFYVAKSALGSFKQDAKRERQAKQRVSRAAASPVTWTIGPAESARAAVGDQRKRRKRAGAVEREAAGGGGEEDAVDEQPVPKCARSEAEGNIEDEETRNGNGGGRQQKEESGDGIPEEVEETIRDMMDELVGPSQSTRSTAANSASSSSSNGHSSAAAATVAAGVAVFFEEREEREAAGRDTNGKRNTRRRVKKEEVKEEEEDEPMKEEEEEDDEERMEEDEDEVKIVKEVKKKEMKREGKEGSNATDDSELPSSPADNNGENGGERDDNGRNGSSSNDDDDDQRPIVFNEALRCDHGGINVSEFRHMVSAEEWARLSGYFENTFEVSTEIPVCDDCKSFDENATADKEASSAIIKALSEQVGDILKAADKRREAAAQVGGAGATEGGEFTRGVCSIFVEAARKVLHARSKARVLPALCQACLLCDHGQPRYGTTPMDEVGRPFIVPLTRDEWERLSSAWRSAMEAAGSSTSACSDEDPTGEFAAAEIELCPISGAVTLQCTPCYESLRQEIEDAKYVFDNQHIYVKMQADEQSTSKSGGEKEEGKEGKEGKEKDKKGSKEGSKEASEEGPDVIPLEIVTLPSSSSNGGNGGGGGGSRVGSRSRRGASKGLIKVRMSSHQTMKDLKIALLKHVHYSPIDQLLYSTVGGQLLDDELTLMEARILPENYDTPIILIVQSGPEAGLNSPTNEKNRAVERGFYDTALAH